MAVSRDLLMSPFWQKRQARLQPAVPKESTGVPWKEVVERLLLDGIDAEAAGAPPGGEDDRIALTRPHEARAALPFAQAAVPGTDVALQAPIGQGVEVPRRNDIVDSALHFAPPER